MKSISHKLVIFFFSNPNLHPKKPPCCFPSRLYKRQASWSWHLKMASGHCWYDSRSFQPYACFPRWQVFFCAPAPPHADLENGLMVCARMYARVDIMTSPAHAASQTSNGRAHTSPWSSWFCWLCSEQHVRIFHIVLCIPRNTFSGFLYKSFIAFVSIPFLFLECPFLFDHF